MSKKYEDELEEGEEREEGEEEEELEEGQIYEGKYKQPLANTELPIGLRGNLSGQREKLSEEEAEDVLETQALFSSQESNFIPEFTEEQLEDATTQIMTIYQAEQGAILQQVTEIQGVMEETLALSTEILMDPKTQLVPVEHMTETEMIRYVVPQLFEQFNVVNQQLTLLNNTGKAMQQTMEDVKETTEKTAANVGDIKETTAKTEQTLEALAGGAVGIQATLNTLMESINEMKSNMGKFNPSTMMTNIMQGFSYMLACISKIIVFLYQTQLYYRTYCTTWSAPIVGPIANFLFTIVFLLIDATIVLGILELIVSQLKLSKLGNETEYILELAELYKKKIYKFITELDVLKIIYKKLSKTFMILLKLLNLKDLYDICMKQLFVSIEGIKNATIVMMEQVVEVGVKGIKTAKVIAHTVQHGFSYAVSSARQGLAFTSAAAEKITDIKKQLSFGLAGVVSNILGYKPSTQAMLTDGSTRQQISQEEQLQEDMMKQAQEEGSKFFKKSVKKPSTKPATTPSRQTAPKSRLSTYFTPNDDVIAPLNSSYIQPNVTSSKKAKKDIFGNKIGEFDDIDDKTTYLTGEQFAETFTSKTGRKIKQRISSVLEFELAKLKEIYEKTEQIIYNSYTFVSDVSSKGASNFLSIIPSVSLQDVLSVVLRNPPKMSTAQEKPKSKSTPKSKSKRSVAKSKGSRKSSPTEKEFYTPTESNVTELNTTGMNTTGMNMTGMNTTGMNMTGMNTTGMNMTGMNTSDIGMNDTEIGMDDTGMNTSDIGMNDTEIGMDDTEFQTPKSSPTTPPNNERWVKSQIASKAEQERSVNMARKMTEKREAEQQAILEREAQQQEEKLAAMRRKQDPAEALNYASDQSKTQSSSWSIFNTPSGPPTEAQRAVEIGKKMAEKRKAEERAKFEKAAQQEAKKLEAERRRSNPYASRLDDSAASFNTPKKGIFWGGGKEDVIGNYTILNKYIIILEPVLLSFEILSLALLTQYKPSISTLPRMIEYANIYIEQQNRTYKSVQKKVQNKHTRINTSVLRSKRTTHKKRSASKRRSANKRRTAYNKSTATKRKSPRRTISKKIRNRNMNYIP
jgi:hypothetical protein